MRPEWLRDGIFFTRAQIQQLGLNDEEIDGLVRDGLLKATSRTVDGAELFPANSVDRVAMIPWAELAKNKERADRREQERLARQQERATATANAKGRRK